MPSETELKQTPEQDQDKTDQADPQGSAKADSAKADASQADADSSSIETDTGQDQVDGGSPGQSAEPSAESVDAAGDEDNATARDGDNATTEDNMTTEDNVTAGDNATRSNLDHILSVRIPIIVKISEKKMSMNNILKFRLGSVIQFDQDAYQHIDLMVNNCTIGLGQPVKIGENFGLRITQIGELADTIKSLGNIPPIDE